MSLLILLLGIFGAAVAAPLASTGDASIDPGAPDAAPAPGPVLSLDDLVPDIMPTSMFHAANALLQVEATKDQRTWLRQKPLANHNGTPKPGHPEHAGSAPVTEPAVKVFNNVEALAPSDEVVPKAALLKAEPPASDMAEVMPEHDFYRKTEPVASPLPIMASTTPSISNAPSESPSTSNSATPPMSPSPEATSSPSPSPTVTESTSASPTPSETASPSSSGTENPSISAVPTSQPSQSVTAMASVTSQPSETPSPSISSSFSLSLAPTDSGSTSFSPSMSVTAVASQTPTISLSPSYTSMPSESAQPSPSASMTETPSNSEAPLPPVASQAPAPRPSSLPLTDFHAHPYERLMYSDETLAPWTYPESGWSASFPKCQDRVNQSPVDLTTFRVASGSEPLVTPQYNASQILFRNTGSYVRGLATFGSTMHFGDQVYDLVYMQVHTPSEHSINGEPFPLEIQWYHRAGDGTIAALSLLYKLGATDNDFVRTIINTAPQEKGDNLTTSAIDLMEALPRDITAYKTGTRVHYPYYTYRGSLTTPPCTDGVKWFVWAKPDVVTEQQVDALHDLFATPSRRGLQPLGDRVVQLKTLF